MTVGHGDGGLPADTLPWYPVLIWLYVYTPPTPPTIIQLRLTPDGRLPYSLLVKRGGLSLTSERAMLTVVVPERPPIWPAMSLAWITTW